MGQNKTVTIHQPDFMPWLGFFNKVSKADEFIVLDHVLNNPRDSAFWGRRVKMLISGQPNWVSVPLHRGRGGTFVPINEMAIQVDERRFATKTLSALRQSYARAPYFSEVAYLFEEYFNHESPLLVDRNWFFISEVLTKLNIRPSIVFSSSLSHSSSSTELLLELLLQRDASIYLCGLGAKSYQDDRLLLDAGIGVKYNSFIPKPYSQFNSKEFIPGLSVVDALMNLGFSGTAELVKGDGE